jgi:K+-sensing histidine kinase KdpD
MKLTRRFLPRLTRARGRVRFAAPETPLRVGMGPASLVSMMSHDFTQPLATVTSLADLLATEWAELPNYVRRDLAVRVDASARGVAARFEHMVVVMDVLGGRVAPGVAVPVRDSVEAAVTSMPPRERIGVSGPATEALMDREHLVHLLATLIADALAYGARPVRVRIVPYAHSVRIEVSDHGQDVLRWICAHTVSSATGSWTLVSRDARRSRLLGLAIAALLIAADGGAISRRPMRRRRGGRVVIHLARPT